MSGGRHPLAGHSAHPNPAGRLDSHIENEYQFPLTTTPTKGHH
jgi:hypothetical protein